MNYKAFFIILVITICLVIFLISSYIMINEVIKFEENEQDHRELVSNAIEIIDNAENNTSRIIDWNYLQSVNPDIIAWIEIEGTKIDYPILKDNDDLYYLKHSYNKKYNSNGAIFTLDNNAFENDETIIFGHNMRNGTMFSELGNYLNSEFLNSHINIKIYTPTKNYIGEIFSCYSIAIDDEDNNIKSLDFNERIEYYKNNSKYKIDISGEIDKIVKLSTCSYINAKTHPTDKRYYIIAKLNDVN